MLLSRQPVDRHGIAELRLPYIPGNTSGLFNGTELRTRSRCVFTTPSGMTSIATPFAYQEFERNDDANEDDDSLTPVGPVHFRARFMPTEVGKHRFHCEFGQQLRGTFHVAGHSALPSSPRVSANHQHFERCHDGNGLRSDEMRCTPMWLVGENIGWGGAWPYHRGSELQSNGSGLSALRFYERVLPKLAGVGGNYFRLWLGPSLVRDVRRATWNDGRPSTFSALCLHCRTRRFGAYSLEAAWRLDRILTLARELRVSALLTLESFQACCVPPKPSRHAPANPEDIAIVGCWWDESAFNERNGGPLFRPAGDYTLIALDRT